MGHRILLHVGEGTVLCDGVQFPSGEVLAQEVTDLLHISSEVLCLQSCIRATHILDLRAWLSPHYGF